MIYIFLCILKYIYFMIYIYIYIYIYIFQIYFLIIIVVYLKCYNFTCDILGIYLFLYLRNCNADILRFDDFKYTWIQIYQLTNTAFVSQTWSRVKDTILVSHDFKIRLETDRKLEKEERGGGETGRKRERPRWAAAFFSIRWEST